MIYELHVRDFSARDPTVGAKICLESIRFRVQGFRGWLAPKHGFLGSEKLPGGLIFGSNQGLASSPKHGLLGFN